MTDDQLAAARSNAQRTYDRRRARSAAETLANIPPNRWDEATKKMLLTLATLAAPSRIDEVLDEAFEPPIGGAENPYDMPSPYDGPDSPDIREAFALDLRRMGLMGTVPRPEPRPYPDPRPRPDPDPRPRPEPHPNTVCKDHAHLNIVGIYNLGCAACAESHDAADAR